MMIDFLSLRIHFISYVEVIDLMYIKLSELYQSQAIRYCIVGGMNTAVTAAVFIVLTAFGYGLYVSNFSGYIVGILFSYVLNTYFTFSSTLSFRRLVKFAACCSACYAINLVAMRLSMALGFANEYLIQLTGMFFYTISGFLVNKLWVMK
ncbi:GtrA family protein [Escherichia coli]|uniref:GtrA family protein n=2 Tax=Escherichia coli TaxID=562 RepID=UPI002E111EA3